MRWALMISAVVLVGVVLFGVQRMGAQERVKAVAVADDGAAFEKEAAGKVLVIFRGSTDLGGNTFGVQEAKLRMVAGRRFLTGTFAESIGEANTALRGFPVNVSWESVTEYLVLTPEAYRKWLEAASDVSASVVNR
jgi:hypothetical protein